ncbi:hypothetical protein HNQ91_000177 [Filimonas zeae]|uniref:Uncharacterized protein n=1 Tax=Filimonas zeae TaxID=1737353 RepID=A0A917INP6_9BACT|nr:hypothetical protein [Filimonas zeae]MDR6337155.1 hypothetical protein [Filimonas zeae]GGH57253.1 hypothetical protein GCM10011379_01740 [Filimonas zeae]
MAEDIVAPYIPAQYTGEETETSHTLEAPDEETALAWFDILALRLKDVNNWNKWCGFLSSGFQLTDDKGNKLALAAAEGQFIQIDIPGPGPIAGNGYDWVQIEKLEQVKLNERQEFVVLQARPAASPFNNMNGVAHFLDKEATSSFVVKRDGLTLTTTVYGRNEVPNVHVHETADRIRNAVAGSAGAIGISKLQWKALVKGLFDFLDKKT